MGPAHVATTRLSGHDVTPCPPDGHDVTPCPPGWGATPRSRPHPDLPDGRAYGIRLSLADVKGISRPRWRGSSPAGPFRSLADFWHRAQVSRPVVERLVVAGAFDSLYGLGATLPVRRRDRVTRRDLLLQVAELDRWSRAATVGCPGPGAGAGPAQADPRIGAGASPGRRQAEPGAVASGPPPPGSRRRRARSPPPSSRPVQLALDLGDAPDETVPSGLPEMTGAERVRAELDVLGLDASRHVLDFYTPLLDALASPAPGTCCTVAAGRSCSSPG